MTWRCRLVRGSNIDFAKLEVGDMYFIDVPADELVKYKLSAYYFEHNAARKPLMVLLPGRHFFMVDGQCYDSKRGGYYGGWQVTGVPPNITVHPSINMVGYYHGWLKNGVLGDPL
jgi:hypothetical protein